MILDHWSWRSRPKIEDEGVTLRLENSYQWRIPGIMLLNKQMDYDRCLYSTKRRPDVHVGQ